MKGEERKLTNLLEGAKTRFIIPVYQRNYDWKMEHCRRLFDDLEEVISEKRNNHFFGSIVSSAFAEERILIDGQQRITTVLLIMLALIHSLRTGKVVSADSSLAERIRLEYLIDRWHPEEQKLKLKLVKDDQEAFIRIFMEDSEELITDSNVTQNYNYFLNRIETMSISPDELFAAIEKLMIIDITLHKEDDAQLVFESLNSTGLDLSEGDKIRNFLLMGLSSDLQEKYYENYWNKIEKNTSYDVSSFVRDYIASVKRSTPAIRKVYAVFKEYVKEMPSPLEKLLDNLLKYSKYILQITSATSPYPMSNTVLSRLNLLEMSVLNPYLLALMDYASGGGLKDDDIVMVLRSVEIYLFRRWVCNVPTNALNKVFETLHGDILRGMKQGGSYLDVLNYILLHKEGAGRFPDDSEFLAAMENRNFYNIQNKKKYLYDRLENRNSKERVNVIAGLENDTLSVEHIMPQTLSPQWKQDFGEEIWDIVHEKWLNRLANLTLTGYNSEYSNKRFIEKREAKNGFKDSGLRINKFISQCNQWTEAELSERNESLKKDFLTLWPMISTTVELKEHINEEHSFDEDFDFTNRKIAAYTFMGSRYTVKTWLEMEIGVMRLLGELDAPALIKLTREEKYPSSHFSDTPRSTFVEVMKDVYIYAATATQTKLDLIGSVFDRFGIDRGDLSFEIYQDAMDIRSILFQALTFWCEEWSQEGLILFSKVHSIKTLIRFTTASMNRILFPEQDPNTSNRSGWNDESHYYYEINNRPPKLRINLVLSSKGLIGDNLKNATKMQNSVNSQGFKDNWQWCTVTGWQMQDRQLETTDDFELAADDIKSELRRIITEDIPVFESWISGVISAPQT